MLEMGSSLVSSSKFKPDSKLEENKAKARMNFLKPKYKKNLFYTKLLYLTGFDCRFDQARSSLSLKFKARARLGLDKIKLDPSLTVMLY